MKAKFAEYLESLSKEGKVVGKSENFVVHLTKAREKLAEFQVSEPAYCFLKWYQAAVAGGAQEIYFEMESDHYVMIIPFPEQVALGDLCRAFDGEEVDLCRRDRLFLEGLLACTSADFETSICTDEESHVLSAGGLQKPKWWARLASYHKVYKENSVRVGVKVKHSKGFRRRIIERIGERTRFGPILCYFVLDPARSPSVLEREVPVFPEAPSGEGWFDEFSRKEVLLEAWTEEGSLCRSRAKKLEKKSKTSRHPDSLVFAPQESADAAVLVSLHLAGQAQMVPVQHGVCLDPIRRDLGYPGLVVAFAADDMRTDLSGLKLIEDEAYQERVEGLRRTVDGVIEQHLLKIQEVEARKKWSLHPIGTLVGALVGILPALKAVFLFQLVAIGVSALSGNAVERFLRRHELEAARRQRTKAFRAEIFKRLKGEGAGG